MVAPRALDALLHEAAEHLVDTRGMLLAVAQLHRVLLFLDLSDLPAVPALARLLNCSLLRLFRVSLALVLRESPPPAPKLALCHFHLNIM